MVSLEVSELEQALTAAGGSSRSLAADVVGVGVVVVVDVVVVVGNGCLPEELEL